MTSHTVVIIGAGPGGLAVAADLVDRGIECVVFERGEVGQSWLIYPSDTHLLSESTEREGHHDENMISDIPTSEVFPNIPHPNHLMYQKYLQHVADVKKLPVQVGVEIKTVIFNPEMKKFLVTTTTNEEFLADFVVWAGGMYSTPDDDMDSSGAFIHYANMPYLDNVDETEVTVVGGANGASSVVLQVAKPDRKVNLVVSKPYTIPMPIDCLWKEQMAFIQQLEKQGLVKIIENFRVKRIYERAEEKKFVLESEQGEELVVPARPIICTGFLPNVGPVANLVDIKKSDHQELLEINEAHESQKTPGLYIAGTVGKLDHESGFIRHFRDFGKVIGDDIEKKLASHAA